MLFVAARLPRSRCWPTTASRSCSPPGSTFGFALQTFIIVGGVLRVIPLTGITLPFVSYGGSSVVANFVLLALLLLVSNRANAQTREGAREQADHAPRRRRRSACSSRSIVATTYWQAWAAPATSPTGRTTQIQRVAQFTIKRGEITPATARRLARQPREEGRRPDALLPRVPAARARGPRRRLLDAGALPRRARALDERLPDRLEREPLDRARHRRSTSSRARRSRATTSRSTLNPQAQRAALERARQRAAARSSRSSRRPGRCCVMASSPTYDPNLVESHFGRVDAAHAPTASGRDALLNRADRRASTRPARPSRS